MVYLIGLLTHTNTMVYLIGFTDTHQYYGLFNWFARDCYNVTFKIQIKKFCIFSKAFTQAATSKGYCPKSQLPNRSISRVCPSRRSRSAPYPVLAAALGPYISLSATLGPH